MCLLFLYAALFYAASGRRILPAGLRFCMSRSAQRAKNGPQSRKQTTSLLPAAGAGSCVLVLADLSGPFFPVVFNLFMSDIEN